MNIIHRTLLILIALQFSACSKDHTQTSNINTNTSAAEKTQGVLTAAQTKALEQTKAVEEALKQAEAARRKQLDEAQ